MSISAGVAGGDNAKSSGSLHSAHDSIGSTGFGSSCSTGVSKFVVARLSSTMSATLSLGGVSMFSSVVASSGKVANGWPSTMEALRQTCFTRGPFRSIRCRLSWPFAGDAAAVGVVVVVVLVAAVVVVTLDVTTGVVATAVVIAIDTGESDAVVVTTAVSSLLLVLTVLLDVSLSLDKSSSFFSLVAGTASSFWTEGLLLPLGLPRALGASIDGFSVVFNLIGGELPKVVLFCASGFARDRNEFDLANSGLSMLPACQSIREPAGFCPLTKLFEKMLFSTGSFLAEWLFELFVSTCRMFNGSVCVNRIFRTGGN